MWGFEKDQGFCETQDCAVGYFEDWYTHMLDYHSHSYYEISLILTGNVKSLLAEQSEEGEQSRLVMTAPQMPHWIFLAEPSFYSRINLYFSERFIADSVPEWNDLVKIFKTKGSILLLTEAQKELAVEKMRAIAEEENAFRKRLKVLEFLSYVAEFSENTQQEKQKTPLFITQALEYIQKNYTQKITAADLAWRVGVSRTTFMLAFKRYVGITFVEYVTRVRLKAAVALLKDGHSQEFVAEQTGFCNGCGLIRAFRRCYGITPKSYIERNSARVI